MAKAKATETTKTPKATKTTKVTKTTTKTQTKYAPKVGIVIPVYNTPIAYFRECVESALNQDYKDLEILIIHDGHYAPCVEVSLEYATKDPRVSVIVKPLNEGVSIARNIGIDYFSKTLSFKETQAQGGLSAFSIEGANPFGIGAVYKQTKATKGGLIPSAIDYIYFLDSDDMCQSDLVSRCVQCASGNSLVWFNFNKMSNEGVLHLGKHIKDLEILDKERAITPDEWLKHSVDTGCGSAIFVWQVFIDFKFLQDIKLRFLNQVMREDNLFGMCLILQCKTMYMLPDKLINYRVRTNGETNFASDSEQVFLPGFLRPLFEALGGDLILTKHFYVAVSWFIQKLYFLEFIKQFNGKPNMEVIVSGMLNRFREQTMQFVHLPTQLGPDYYFNIAFNVFLNILKAMPNDDPYYRPFDKLAEYITQCDNTQQETIRLIKEVLVCENEIIKGKNQIIMDLQKRLQELEAQNVELKTAKAKKGQ